jgi:hypothetical protein
VRSVFCPFPMSIGSSGAEDSGTKGMSACEEGGVGSVSMSSPGVWESGTSVVALAAGVGS